MTKIIYVTSDGASTTVDAEDGSNVMQTALDNNVPGIIGQCGGGMICATCHVYVPPEFADLLGPVGTEENDMLEVVTTGRRPNSRLSCQITIKPELNGLTVNIPESQY